MKHPPSGCFGGLIVHQFANNELNGLTLLVYFMCAACSNHLATVVRVSGCCYKLTLKAFFLCLSDEWKCVQLVARNASVQHNHVKRVRCDESIRGHERTCKETLCTLGKTCAP